MTHKLLFSCILITLLYVLSFIGYHTTFHDHTFLPDQGSKEHRLDVKVINNEWRVVFADDENQSDVIARRGDRIIWNVEGSDATFRFPNRGIFGYRTRKVKEGNQLVLPVSSNSPLGEFDYTVFIENAGTNARGQSPPRIIVRE